MLQGDEDDTHKKLVIVRSGDNEFNDEFEDDGNETKMDYVPPGVSTPIVLGGRRGAHTVEEKLDLIDQHGTALRYFADNADPSMFPNFHLEVGHSVHAASGLATEFYPEFYPMNVARDVLEHDSKKYVVLKNDEPLLHLFKLTLEKLLLKARVDDTSNVLKAPEVIGDINSDPPHSTDERIIPDNHAQPIPPPLNVDPVTVPPNLNTHLDMTQILTAVNTDLTKDEDSIPPSNVGSRGNEQSDDVSSGKKGRKGRNRMKKGHDSNDEHCDQVIMNQVHSDGQFLMIHEQLNLPPSSKMRKWMKCAAFEGGFNLYINLIAVKRIDHLFSDPITLDLNANTITLQRNENSTIFSVSFDISHKLVYPRFFDDMLDYDQDATFTLAPGVNCRIEHQQRAQSVFIANIDPFD